MPVSQKNFNSHGASVRRFKTAAFYVPSPAAVKRRGRSQVGRLVPLTQERHCISHSLPQEGWGLTRMMKSDDRRRPALTQTGAVMALGFSLLCSSARRAVRSAASLKLPSIPTTT